MKDYHFHCSHPDSDKANNACLDRRKRQTMPDGLSAESRILRALDGYLIPAGLFTRLVEAVRDAELFSANQARS